MTGAVFDGDTQEAEPITLCPAMSKRVIMPGLPNPAYCCVNAGVARRHLKGLPIALAACDCLCHWQGEP